MNTLNVATSWPIVEHQRARAPTYNDAKASTGARANLFFLFFLAQGARSSSACGTAGTPGVPSPARGRSAGRAMANRCPIRRPDRAVIVAGSRGGVRAQPKFPYDVQLTQLDVVASAASVTTAFSRATMPSSVIWSFDRHRKHGLLAGPIGSAESHFRGFHGRLAAKNIVIAVPPAA